jgi:hypothetical protein
VDIDMTQTRIDGELHPQFDDPVSESMGRAGRSLV